MCVGVCGNGIVTQDERCDDGNLNNDDGCSASCLAENGYSCTGAPSICVTMCGDSIVAGAETCDDGGTIAGDCCSSTCTIEAGCEIEPNNTSATANAYSMVFINDVVKGFMQPTDVDYFEISIPAGNAGTIAAITGTGPLGTTCASINILDTDITLTDSSGFVYGYNDDISTSNYCSSVNVASLGPGTYYVKVMRSPVAPPTNNTFDYSLQVTMTLTALVDECAMGTADCVAGATCTDTPGSFICICPNGTYGNGRTSGSGCAAGTGLYYSFDGTGNMVPNLAVTPPAGTASATIIGAQSQGGTGKCGGALIGTGAPSNVDFVDTNWMTNLSNSWTISFWLSNFDDTATARYLFGDFGANKFRLQAGGGLGAHNMALVGVGMNTLIVLNSANTAPTMTTFVHDAIARTITAYVDATPVTVVFQPPNLSFTGTTNFGVGAMRGVPNSGMPVGALMDEFHLYFRALSAAEVATLASPACGP